VTRKRAEEYRRLAEECLIGARMKRLFLIRHAKSSWDDPALPDKDRPLGDRGRRDARKMGKRLAKRDVKPDLILSSPARRALKTARIIAKKLDYKLKDIVVDDRLYAGAVANGSIDSQVGGRICNGLGIVRACLETQKLEQLEARMDEIADRVARDRTNAARERTSTHEAQHPSH
jgi:bisphosphoglycerate-dependent phosphoglycerate mutase